MSLLFTAEFGGPLLLVLGVAATNAAMLVRGPHPPPRGRLGAALLLFGHALTVLLVFSEITR